MYFGLIYHYQALKYNSNIEKRVKKKKLIKKKKIKKSFLDLTMCAMMKVRKPFATKWSCYIQTNSEFSQ